MIQLLVSVRSVAEARAAIEGGADIIDIKEPLNGPLGAASAKVCADIIKAVGDDHVITASLGELSEYPKRVATASLEGCRLGKLGLSHCTPLSDWAGVWKQVWKSFPKAMGAVGVAYADYATAHAPPPSEVLKLAQQSKCKAFLIDTFEKVKSDVFDLLPGREIKRLLEEARQSGMMAVLAGGLRIGRLQEALEVVPDVVAVRGGVCNGTRTGEVSAELVKLWKIRLNKRQRGPKPNTLIS